jgi:hypothetical protein
MIKKISGWILLLAAVMEIIVNSQKIWEVIKMVDRSIILEVGPVAIFIIAGIIYLREKYKEFRNKLQSVLLVIDSAQYGARGQVNDVTDILSSRIIYGRLERFPVTNATLGPDPIYGTPKTLTVKYKYCGKPHTISVPEGGTLSLPE